MLILKNVTRTFISKENNINALEKVNLEVKDKEFICILGPSGCGKTTLLRIIAGLDKPTAGEVLLDDIRVDKPGQDRGMVFQDYSLFPWRTVIDNIAFGLEVLGVDKKERYESAREYLELLDLEKFENSFPYELSGGMRQRIAIVRALINNPKLLLMDEPFGALDAQTRNIMQAELLRIWEKKHKTILFVTHSVDEAVYLADRIVVMSARPGTIKEIFNIDLPHPRIRTSQEANLIRDRILKSLGTEMEHAKK
ncbi:MAG: ABC transporter ATP-binding protein [Euryarchaeota archaeon]|nr:ABC transporter ATP-binding protein [Euryarchaeota archaeon]MBU4221941.1 ABC transporter ATP-binding protein [Euryarchaeota archaeon]MCG2736239.1 ABC transporter ATP-binding protein [Candidatus Methanoperedenaceae archaeon]